MKKLLADKAGAYLSQKLARIDHTNHLDFDFEKCRLGPYDKDKVIKLLDKLAIKALTARLP